MVHDKEGTLLELSTDVIKIMEDEQGNIFKHQHNEIKKQDIKIIIERDVVTDKTGEVISKETDMRTIEGGVNNNIHQRETDVIEGTDGRTIVIEKSIVEDSRGNIIKTEVEKYEINQDDISKAQGPGNGEQLNTVEVLS
jgi:ATP-dependent protease Clp ATPase subunit